MYHCERLFATNVAAIGAISWSVCCADQMRCRLSLAETQLLAGRLEEAHALAEGTLTQAREHQGHGNEAYALRRR
jgi:hypothetical protein